jgi:tripeptide aminopeptidase
MDTVEPGTGIKPVFADGVFRSNGTTVLGGDDKAAIAILLEAVNCLQENRIDFGPMEMVFTTCEEIGLLGAKALDPSVLKARAGYTLDSTDPDAVINSAPAAVRFIIKVHGRSAHAGINPDKGINAIRIAAEAISCVPQGRIDQDTTCNIGLIRGGNATNIVPDLVEVKGEVRSHDGRQLKEIQDEMTGCFYRVAEKYRAQSETQGRKSKEPFVTSSVRDDYPLMKVPRDHPVVTTVLEAGKNLGRDLRLEKTGGGSDANIFNRKGLSTVILGIGMLKVHTTEEFIRLSDMVDSCRLVLEIINCWK